MESANIEKIIDLLSDYIREYEEKEKYNEILITQSQLYKELLSLIDKNYKILDDDVLDVIVINVSKGNNTLTEVAVPSEVSKDDIILTVRQLLMIMVDEEVFNKAVTKEV